MLLKWYAFQFLFFRLQCLLLNKPSPFHFHPQLLPNKDPWATSEGSASIAPELDLFAMKPVESVSAAAAASPTSAEPVISPTEAPETLSPATNTTTTTSTTATTSATAEPAAPATLDLFSGNVSASVLLLSCFNLHYDELAKLVPQHY